MIKIPSKFNTWTYSEIIGNEYTSLLLWTELGLQKAGREKFGYTFIVIPNFSKMLVFFQCEMEFNFCFYLV